MAVLICIPTNSVRGELFSTPSPEFIACRLLDRSHSDWREMVPHSGFDLHFSDNEWCWAFFHVFVFYGEMSSSLAHVLIGSFIFLELSCRSCLYIFEISCLTAFRVGENNSKWSNWQTTNLCFLICCICCHRFSSKEQASFNFMAAVTICSDFADPPKKSLSLFPLFPHLFTKKWWDNHFRSSIGSLGIGRPSWMPWS